MLFCSKGQRDITDVSLGFDLIPFHGKFPTDTRIRPSVNAALSLKTRRALKQRLTPWRESGIFMMEGEMSSCGCK